MADGASESKAPRVCVVTGGAQGIGFGVAQHMGTKEGCKIALFDINEETLSKAKATLEAAGVEAMTHAIDVTDPAQWEAGLRAVKETLGGVDILVNSAGITGKTGIKTEEVDPADFAKVFAVNTTGTFLGCKFALPHMVAAGGGRIINIASIAGKEGNAGMVAYSASKAAVIGLTKATGKEYAETGITVNAIAPAVVRTEMVARMPAEQVKYMTDKIPMKRTGEISEIAALVAFIASPDASFTTGFTFDATGGRATY